MKRMFDAFFHVDMHRKEAQMGKSLNGKELGRGIMQRKSDGLYQGRFVNCFGKTQTIYAKTRFVRSCGQSSTRMRRHLTSFPRI